MLHPALPPTQPPPRDTHYTPERRPSETPLPRVLRACDHLADLVYCCLPVPFAESTLHLVLRLRGGMGHKSNPWKKAHSKMRWKWKKKRTRRLQRKRRKMRQRSK